MHLMKYTEWEAVSGWKTGDVSDLAHNSNAWWYPARLLNISVTDYINLLITKYNAHSFCYCKETNILTWKWTKEDNHKFTLFINNTSRKKNFMIC